jgi:hypothetical protein
MGAVMGAKAKRREAKMEYYALRHDGDITVQ